LLKLKHIIPVLLILLKAGFLFDKGTGFVSGHFPASFRTAQACFGAFLAMVMAVFPAFLPTCFANFRTQIANLLHKRAVALHRLQCQSTNICAFSVHADTASHHFHIVFL
jgi:hypothetical protein